MTTICREVQQSTGAAKAVTSVTYTGYAHEGTNKTYSTNYVPSTWSGKLMYIKGSLDNCTVSSHYLILRDGSKKLINTTKGILSKTGGWTNFGPIYFDGSYDVVGIYVDSYGVADDGADGHGGSCTLYGIPSAWKSE